MDLTPFECIFRPVKQLLIESQSLKLESGAYPVSFRSHNLLMRRFYLFWAFYIYIEYKIIY